MKLEFEITKKDLTSEGDIPNSFKERIYNHLVDNGLIICPSDTCYSVAAMCTHLYIGNLLTIILERDNMPFSVAFDNTETVSKYVESSDKVLLRLLDRFTPGPITCIGIVNENYRNLSKIIHAEGDDVGVRIPDSKIERTIAEIVKSPITTVPVKMGNDPPIKDYNKAISCIEESLNNKNLIESVKIAAIESNFSFAERLSTVVHVYHATKELRILRPGYISKDELNIFLKKHYFNINGWKVVEAKGKGINNTTHDN